MNPTVLSPCPSCGGAAIGPKKSSSGDERNGYNFTVTIRCECGFNASRPSREGRGGWCIDKGEAEAELIALWNKRTPITKPATYRTDVPYNYRAIAHLIGSIYFAGDFVAETANERTLESLLREVGTRYASWAEVDEGYDKLQLPSLACWPPHDSHECKKCHPDSGSNVKLETYWLVELFLPGGNSLGYYHTGFTDISGQSRATKNPHEARKYSSLENANAMAKRLHSKQGVWKAISHGFYLGMK